MTSKQIDKEARRWWKEVMGVPPRLIDPYDLQAVGDLIYLAYWSGYQDGKNGKKVRKQPWRPYTKL